MDIKSQYREKNVDVVLSILFSMLIVTSIFGWAIMAINAIFKFGW